MYVYKQIVIIEPEFFTQLELDYQRRHTYTHLHHTRVSTYAYTNVNMLPIHVYSYWQLEKGISRFGKAAS